MACINRAQPREASFRCLSPCASRRSSKQVKDAGELSATIADSIQWSKHKVLNIVDAAAHDL